MDKYLSICLGGAVGVYFCVQLLVLVVGVYDFVDSWSELIIYIDIFLYNIKYN